MQNVAERTGNTNSVQQVNNAKNAVEIETGETNAIQLFASCKDWEQLNKALHHKFGYVMSIEFETQREIDNWMLAFDMWIESNSDDKDSDLEFMVTQWKKKLKMKT